MNPEAHEALVKSIETKTKSLQRSAEDAQNEFQQQQNEIAQRILQKLAPVITKYTTDNGYGLLLDASAPWPQGPVVVATQAVDITKAVVDAYNVQSGVPAPVKSSAATGQGRPAATAPGATKPACARRRQPSQLPHDYQAAVSTQLLRLRRSSARVAFFVADGSCLGDGVLQAHWHHPMGLAIADRGCGKTCGLPY